MKRFTETEKWRDPWFRKLSAGAKLAFIYIIENCDNAGVWSGDKELAEFQIGMAIQWDKVLPAFEDRVKVLPGGEWLLTKFVSFQFGQLSAECKPHLQVIRLIEKHRVSKGYPKGINTLEEKKKEKRKKGSAEGDKIPDLTETLAEIAGLPELWTEFIQHRKEIKKPLTPLAASRIIGSLEERPTEAVEALKMAVRRGWQGFEWSWFDKEKPTRANGSPVAAPLPSSTDLYAARQ